jgi:hypothetical protein
LIEPFFKDFSLYDVYFKWKKFLQVTFQQPLNQRGFQFEPKKLEFCFLNIRIKNRLYFLFVKLWRKWRVPCNDGISLVHLSIWLHSFWNIWWFSSLIRSFQWLLKKIRLFGAAMNYDANIINLLLHFIWVVNYSAFCRLHTIKKTPFT